MARRRMVGCLPLWTAGCGVLGGVLATSSSPVGSAVVAVLLWLLGLPVCFVIALMTKKPGPRPPGTKPAASAPPPGEPSRAHLAAQARRELEEARGIAQLIDEAERGPFLAEAEAKFRRRMRDLLT